MSDFFNSGWSVFIAAVTILGLVGCLALLFGASRRKVMSATDNTTGHVWDGDLVELNNPLPRWWMMLFIITVVFGAIYLALYPGLGARAGTLQWSSTGEHQADVAAARAQIAPLYARFNALAPEALAKDAQAMALGERLFVNNCAQCHGSNARGSKGFPNLTDNDWLWGGAPERIMETIREGRNGNMPPMAAAVGTSEEVRNVANYVLSLSDSPHNSVAAQLGRPKFVVCAACHGIDGAQPTTPEYPKLAGQYPDYLSKALRDYKSGARKNPIMAGMAAGLTEADIENLAAYFYTQPGVLASKY